MAVLDWLVQEPSLTLSGEGVVLRAPRMADYPDWAELRRNSREFLQPWEPTWPADDLTRSAFRRRLGIYNRDFDLGLHRIEAACCPENDASSRLLRRAGFQEEGLARAYLKINGVWRDHLLFGLVRGDYPDEDLRPFDG